jgi:hypothetical protein
VATDSVVDGARDGAGLPKGTTHSGTNFFVEYNAIENWFELELGVSVFPQNGGAEVSSDFLFNKPLQLTHNLECMLGGGPELVRARFTARKAEPSWAVKRSPISCFGRGNISAYGQSRATFSCSVTGGLGTTGGIIFGW